MPSNRSVTPNFGAASDTTSAKLWFLIFLLLRPCGPPTIGSLLELRDYRGLIYAFGLVRRPKLNCSLKNY